MSDQENIPGLQPHIAALRERAAQAQRLAREVTDKLAREGLLEHAKEFERRAAELEAQLAVLKQAGPPAEAEAAALKAPQEKPEDER